MQKPIKVTRGSFNRFFSLRTLQTNFMFDIKDKIESVADNVEEMVKDYYNLSVLNAVDKGSKLGSLFIVYLLLAALAFFSFLFAGIGLAYWLGQLLGNSMYGFFIMAGFLLLCFLVIMLLKGKVIIPFLRNFIIKNIYD